MKKINSQDKVTIAGEDYIWTVNFKASDQTWTITRHDDKYRGRNKAWKFISRSEVPESEMTLVERGNISRLQGITEV